MVTKKETQQGTLLDTKPAELLAKVIREKPDITVAELHLAVKQSTGIENAEEQNKIIEEAQELAKKQAPQSAVTWPTGTNGPETPVPSPTGTNGPTPQPVPTAPEPEKPRPSQPIQAVALSANKQEAEARALSFINTQLWNSMGIMAKTFIESGALPTTIKNAQQLMMILQAGYEAGMQPIQAINSYYFVNGKLSGYGDMLIRQVIKAGHRVEFTEATGTSCTCRIIRGDNNQEMTETVKIDDIPQRLRSKAGPWQEYPKRMLKYKAFAEVAHFLVPEALQGVAVMEDVQPEIEGGDLPKNHKPRVEKRSIAPAPRQHRPLTEVLGS